MEENATLSTPDSATQQADISVWLIIAIVIAVVVFMNCTYATEDERFFGMVLICPVVMVLMGGYIFTYRGKGHLTSRIVFFVFLALSILSVWALVYAIGLSHAFQH